MPDFTVWSTSRLQFLLEDYGLALGSVRALYGRRHEEAIIYEQWIAALEAELQRRGEKT